MARNQISLVSHLCNATKACKNSNQGIEIQNNTCKKDTQAIVRPNRMSLERGPDTVTHNDTSGYVAAVMHAASTIRPYSTSIHRYTAEATK